MTEPEHPPEAAARRLTKLLTAQRDLYEEVRALSQRQSEEISQGSAGDLMSLLGQKQKLISEVELLGQEAAPLHAICEDAADQLDPDIRAGLEEAVGNLRTLLAEIVSLEDECQNALSGAKDGAAEKIEKLQKGKMLHKAYGGGKKASRTARYKDQNG